VINSANIWIIYSIQLHTRLKPYAIFHTGSYGVWRMDRSPGIASCALSSRIANTAFNFILVPFGRLAEWLKLFTPLAAAPSQCRHSNAIKNIDLDYGLLRSIDTPLVGRFKLLEIANMDQTPIGFKFLLS
jgi:hypothetical protein